MSFSAKPKPSPPSDWPRLRRLILTGLGLLAAALVVRFAGEIAAWLGGLLRILRPLAIGIILAYVFNLPVRFFERHLLPRAESKRSLTLRRALAIALSLLLSLGCAVLIVQLIIPNIVAGINLIAARAPEVAESLQLWFEERLHALPWLESWIGQIDVDWGGIVRSLVNRIIEGTSNVLGAAGMIVAGTFRVLVETFLGIMLALYIVATKEDLARKFGRLGALLLPAGGRAFWRRAIDIADQVFSAYTISQLLTAAVLGIVTTIGMLLLRIPYAGMSGTVLGVSSLIPLFGTYIGGGLGMFMIATVNPLQSLVYLVFIVILQQIMGDVVYPRVVGPRIGLPGFWVLLAVLFGGGLFGIVGIMLSVPVCATAYRLFGEWLRANPGLTHEEFRRRWRVRQVRRDIQRQLEWAEAKKVANEAEKEPSEEEQSD
ncbi:MAG: AI-2E family transporter [Bacillota bacterium]|nr:AI-2E family transporter [Bacillota bacterium]